METDRPPSVAPAAATARQLNLVACHRCHQLCRHTDGPAVCPRCGAALHSRKPNSIARCWALVLAAAVFYIPALESVLVPILLVLSAGKFALVAMWYMHLKFDHRLVSWLFFVPRAPIVLTVFISTLVP